MKQLLIILLSIIAIFPSYSQNDKENKLDSLVSVLELEFKKIIYNRESLELIFTDELRNAAKQSIKESSDLINDKFSLASSIGDLAKTMSVVDTVEAYKIVQFVDKTERRINTITKIISTVGILASSAMLLSNNENTELMVGFNVISIVGLLTNKSSKKNKSKIEKLNKAFKYTHNKASRLGVNAYLTLELISISKTMEGIQLKANKLGTRIRQTTLMSDQEIIEASYDCISLLRAMDNFYQLNFEKLKASVSDKSNYKIFDEETKIKLANLTDKIQIAIDAFERVRYLYKRHESVLDSYIKTK